MNTWAGRLWGWLLLAALLSFKATAATYYVNVSNTVPASPFSSWATAATNIQDAVDVSSDGDLILVTNGVYLAGGRTAAGGTLTNRVVITKAVTVQSVNGPEVTIIQGYQVPATTNGAAAVRCVYVTTNAVLSGFTLTNGATQTSGDLPDIGGGGVYCAATNSVVTNCIVTDNSSALQGGGVYGKGWLFNCQLIRNRSNNGGGCNAYGNGENLLRLCNCTLAGNVARTIEGGGAGFAWLTNCLLQTNYAKGGGGGAVGGALYNCTLIGNYTDDFGGGVDSSRMSGCVLIGNHASGNGGGASYVYVGSGITNCVFLGNYANRGGGIYACVADNCIFFTNSAITYGGASHGGNLFNCVVVSNTAGTSGGGTYASSSSYIWNSILYYNTAPANPNSYGSSMGNCCLQATSFTPYYITNEPAFIDWANGDFHLQSNSPCINAGNNAQVQATLDADGKPRIVGGTVDIGAYEYQTPASTLSYVWAQRFGLPTDGSADYADSDGDGSNNWLEWKSGTVPTNAASVLKMSSATNGVSGMVVKWQSVSGITYYLQRSSDLAGGFTSIASNLVGQISITSYTDTTATNASPYFYRVGVQ